MGDKVTNACLGCEERRVGCHSGCSRYAAYLEHKHALVDAKKRAKDADEYFAAKNEKTQQAGMLYKKKQGRR